MLDEFGGNNLEQEALAALEGQPPQVRFEPLRVAYEIAAWVGDGAEFERYARMVIPLAAKYSTQPT